MRQGLPQGAVLSCLLFNIMVDDLKVAIQKVPVFSCVFFADDVVLEVIIEKTVSQLFTLSTKQYLFHLEYKALPRKQVYLSKYLGINQGSKLHWSTHIAETSEKCLKHLNLLKRLTAIKWGATPNVSSTVYKTYVRPVLDYSCEILTLVSTTNLVKNDVVQNNTLRIITGGAKPTPITAMQFQGGIEPLDSRRDKFTLKFWERA
ncbi:putative RNA-directed DNA polymerase from transposon BS [Trichonephila clavipes]|nr:putative RNA-directed DNA polymerase from transposon BS [Trichonephila clavipes]